MAQGAHIWSFIEHFVSQLPFSRQIPKTTYSLEEGEFDYLCPAMCDYKVIDKG